MGNCVSLYKNTNSSAMKLGLQIKSPIEDKFGFKPPTTQQLSNFQDLSHEEELFFDSYGYLESDCEDYFSVNGADYTPSRGNTPVHPCSDIESLDPAEKTIYIDNVANPMPEISSPADMKKLFELFNESFNSSEAKLKSIPHEESVRNSSCSAGATPNRGKVKTGQAAQCCLPNFVRSMSFSERKKRPSSNNMYGH
ncbi:hypothetical protein ACFE04_025118 [Oxalis oulophora]